MAKVTAPLFSIVASGQVGKTVVYDKRGFARVYVIPSNPRTNNQAAIRIPFVGVAAVIKAMNGEVVNHVRQAAESAGFEPYRWAAFLIGTALKGGYWTQKEAEFDALDASAKDAWNYNATQAGINPTTLPYGTTPDKYAGLSMWVMSWAIYEATGYGSGQPSANNAPDWAQTITGQ